MSRNKKILVWSGVAVYFAVFVWSYVLLLEMAL